MQVKKLCNYTWGGKFKTYVFYIKIIYLLKDILFNFKKYFI